ncbi:hypothetical protein BC828DRAFT_401665 [Blastocladiella britannica]|nr:hypothetical protein BC828DRAFT_401665 [Blastocladiella britannica]
MTTDSPPPFMPALLHRREGTWGHTLTQSTAGPAPASATPGSTPASAITSAWLDKEGANATLAQLPPGPMCGSTTCILGTVGCTTWLGWHVCDCAGTNVSFASHSGRRGYFIGGGGRLPPAADCSSGSAVVNLPFFFGSQLTSTVLFTLLLLLAVHDLGAYFWTHPRPPSNGLPLRKRLAGYLSPFLSLRSFLYAIVIGLCSIRLWWSIRGIIGDSSKENGPRRLAYSPLSPVAFIISSQASLTAYTGLLLVWLRNITTTHHETHHQFGASQDCAPPSEQTPNAWWNVIFGKVQALYNRSRLHRLSLSLQRAWHGRFPSTTLSQATSHAKVLYGRGQRLFILVNLFFWFWSFALVIQRFTPPAESSSTGSSRGINWKEPEWGFMLASFFALAIITVSSAIGVERISRQFETCQPPRLQMADVLAVPYKPGETSVLDVEVRQHVKPVQPLPTRIARMTSILMLISAVMRASFAVRAIFPPGAGNVAIGVGFAQRLLEIAGVAVVVYGLSVIPDTEPVGRRHDPNSDLRQLFTMHGSKAKPSACPIMRRMCGGARKSSKSGSVVTFNSPVNSPVGGSTARHLGSIQGLSVPSPSASPALGARRDRMPSALSTDLYSRNGGGSGGGNSGWDSPLATPTTFEEQYLRVYGRALEENPPAVDPKDAPSFARAW